MRNGFKNALSALELLLQYDRKRTCVNDGTINCIIIYWKDSCFGFG